jgi:hypothetical protein
MDSADFFQAVESSGAGTQPEGDMSCNYRATIDRKHRVNRRFVLRVEEYNACLAPIAGHAATVGAPCQ